MVAVPVTPSELCNFLSLTGWMFEQSAPKGIALRDVRTTLSPFDLLVRDLGRTIVYEVISTKGAE